MVRLLGLMGPIASGKSTVAACLKASQCPVVDADAVYHELLASSKHTHLRQQLVDKFGEGILADDGGIDRQKLGSVVFGNEAKLRALNQLTHPVILREIMRRICGLVLGGHRRIVLDIPLLAHYLVRYPRAIRFVLSGVIVVLVPPDVQIRRLMERNGLSEEAAREKIEAQLPPEKQRELADVVVENSGSVEELRQRVGALLQEQPRGWSVWEVAGAWACGVAATFAAFVAQGILGAAIAVAGSVALYHAAGLPASLRQHAE